VPQAQFSMLSIGKLHMKMILITSISREKNILQQFLLSRAAYLLVEIEMPFASFDHQAIMQV
jgi:hypothetical protein